MNHRDKVNFARFTIVLTGEQIIAVILIKALVVQLVQFAAGKTAFIASIKVRITLDNLNVLTLN